MTKKITLTTPLQKAFQLKERNRIRIRILHSRLLFFYFMLFTLNQSYAQTGLINDDFSNSSTYNWVPATAGSTGQIQNGKYLINFPPPSNGKYRADFKKNGGVTFHAGNYPIIAIKINKPPRCNYFFDTNLGSYNGVNNNGTKIVTETGNVYYWNLSTGKLGTTVLSTTQATTLTTFQFKIADIVLTQEEINANKTNYEVDWIKSFSSVDELRLYLNPSGTTEPKFEFSGTFVHPGLLHNTTDLARIKDLVNRKVSRPYQSYQLLVASGKASATYVMKGPYTLITRDNTLTVDGVAGGTVKNNIESDFLAAYYNALMYQINGNEAHALKAIEILDAYSSITTGIVGTDSELNGLYGFILTNAAEIMRATYPAWATNKILQCQNMLKSVFYPVIGNFKPCSHGNWDIICMKALMAIAIFSDDIPMFNKTINYYYYGEGNGSIKKYVLTDAGQLQESNRDQPHVMLALGSMAELAEMALKQGIDLYAANNNAILRGYEYTSKYNLGFEVPYQTSYDYCEKNYSDYTPTAISTSGRGQFRSVFEIVYNHYVYRKGLQMPQTLEVLANMGPEGAPFGADNTGYGSLLFYLNNTDNHVFPTLGLIDDNFTTTTDNWKAVTAGSVASSENEQLKITTVLLSNGKSRGDIQKNNTTVHAGSYPILAIKIKKPLNCNFILDTNLGTYGNGSNKWTGKVGEEIYYYDLSKTGFGSTPNMLSIINPTTLSTFQFKVADITSGETEYMVDWVKTVKNISELIALDPATGLINDNFTTTTEGWSTTTSGATSTSDAGHLRVNLSKQSNGSYRGDIKKTAGTTVYPANFPIVAIKFKKPTIGNIIFDTNLGSFGNGSNKWTGKIGNDIYYFDLSKTGFGTNSTLTTPTALTTFQFKIADITSGETNYQVDWIKTVKTVAELQAFINPSYQTISFSELNTQKVGNPDFDPAISSSGLKITYSSSDENITSIIDGKIHIITAGTTEITATQTGDSNYYPADIVKRNLVVIKNDQFISFNALPQKAIDTESFDAGATASSGLAVSYTSSNPDVAIIIDNKIHLIGAGTSIITASQSGDNTYNQATDVSQILTVIATLKVKYQDGDNNPTNNNIKPNLTIYNEGTVAIPYNELTLRYWVTPENYTGINTWIDYAQLGSNKVKMTYVALPEPKNGAYGYVEYGFEATAGNLLAGANSGLIQSRFANSNWSNLNENDDYSHTNASAFVYNEHITMYRNGQLVWGVEPVVTAAAVDLKVYTETKSSATTNSISTYLKINNEGNVPVAYGDVKVRYWFTKEGTANLNYYLDYAVLGNSNIESGFVTLNPVQNAANTYLELGVKSSSGTLYPSSSTDNIQYRITKSDWSNFNQADDYSYNTNKTMSLNDKVTVYYKGQLIYGTEPSITTTNKISAEQEKSLLDKTISGAQLEAVIVYPNPVTTLLSIKVSEVHNNATLELYNSLGMKVLSQTLKSTSEVMYMDKLPTGMYFLNIKNGTEITVKKILKK